MTAVAHVVAEDTGVGFVAQPGQQLFYDEAAGCIHLIEGRMITAVALPQPMYGTGTGSSGGGSGAALPGDSSPLVGRASSQVSDAHSGDHAPNNDPSGGYESDDSIASSTARAFLVSEGPAVRHIRSSLDGAFTALHRSARLVEVHCHATGNMFVETPGGADKAGRRGSDPQLLGFFWTAAHFVMVTAGGLEIHRVHPSLQALRLDSLVPLQGVQWYTYSPETHMVVLGFGSSGAKLQAIQFSKAGILKLPLLDLTPPWGSPIRPVMAAAISTALDGFSAAREQPARLVGPDTCWVVVLYGRVFCCHHDRGAGLLRLYRLYRDATSLAHCYEVYARQLELSVVDHVLLVHHIDSAVVMLLDIMAPGPAPVSSPLPLAVRLPQEHEAGQEQRQEAPALPPSTGSSSGGGAAAAEALHAAAAQQQLPVFAGPSALQLHYPAWLVDGAGGAVYRLQLDLRAISDSQSDYPCLLAFLQRRRPAPAPRRDAAGITLRVLRGIIQDEAPLPELRTCLDVVNSFSAEAGGSGSSGGARAAAAAAAAAARHRPEVASQDMHRSVFSLARTQQRVRPAYLQAALAEYAASCAAHRIQLAPALAALYVDLLLDQGLSHLVSPLLLSHPQLDSVLLAEHVEEASAAGQLPAGGQLAEQLLLRLHAHEARCRLLLRQGRVREALLLAQRERLVGQLSPAALMEAAADGGDPLLAAAAKRMCSAAMPAAA